MNRITKTIKWSLAVMLVSLVGVCEAAEVKAGTAQADTPQAKKASAPQQRRNKRRKKRRKKPKLAVGQMAPDFALVSLAEMPGSVRAATRPAKSPTSQPAPKKVRLSDFRGGKPVVMIFSSYT